MGNYVKYGDERMPCPYCGESVSRFARVCRFCNRTIDPILRQLEEVQQNCRKDEKNINTAATRKVPTVSVSSQVAKSRMTYILLAIFLGLLGMHNFYAGYIARGIGQFLMTLFLGWLVIPLIVEGVWIIIEICVVDTDADGIRMREG